RATAVSHYYSETRDIAIYLASLFKASFPAYYEKYSKAFEAGQWTEADPGPWIGRAVVFKLQVECHVDGLDNGPSAIFCAGEGRFSGGECLLPDLNIKLSYRPGHVFIFMAAHLYHQIMPWKPLGSRDEHQMAPGRVGHVFFFPENSLAILDGKPEKWNQRTGGGLKDSNRDPTYTKLDLPLGTQNYLRSLSGQPLLPV
ncbi:hypothetical protein CYLTODRAFT_360727, partial [Cylindrobasidium torrendii FP15055 ss-10]